MVVITLLDFVQLIRQFSQGRSFGFDLCVDMPLVSDSCFLLNRQAIDLMVLLADIRGQAIPPQPGQSSLEFTFFFL